MLCKHPGYTVSYSGAATLLAIAHCTACNVEWTYLTYLPLTPHYDQTITDITDIIPDPIKTILWMDLLYAMGITSSKHYHIIPGLLHFLNIARNNNEDNPPCEN